MSNMFYRAFEDRHRGSFELIKSRLEIYLPFINPLKTLSKAPKALDLGCGRGEWLELLQQQGFQAKGVDLDEGMLQECKTRHLDVFQGDAIAYLKDLPDKSLHVISAFHLVEHIPFDVLQLLITESHRVLESGGVLILETPNPESLLVGTSSFYLDPTHKRPLPSALLSFAVEFAQFARVKTLFLQEPQNLDNAKHIGLIDILEGVSPDYAIVSQKAAKHHISALFDAPFEKNYGTRLLTLAQRFDQQIQNNILSLQHALNTSQCKIDKLTQLISHLETTVANQQQKIEQLEKQPNQFLTSSVLTKNNNSDLTHHERHLSWQVQYLENELDIIKQKINDYEKSNHTLCVITDKTYQELQEFKRNKMTIFRLLRSIIRIVKHYTPKSLKNIYQKIRTGLKKIIKRSLRLFIKIIFATKSNKLLSKLLIHHPTLKARIRQLAMRIGVIRQTPTFESLSTNTPQGILENFRTNHSTKCLSSHATQIYNLLQKAIIENRKGSR